MLLFHFVFDLEICTKFLNFLFNFCFILLRRKHFKFLLTVSKIVWLWGLVSVRIERCDFSTDWFVVTFEKNESIHYCWVKKLSIQRLFVLHLLVIGLTMKTQANAHKCAYLIGTPGTPHSFCMWCGQQSEKRRAKRVQRSCFFFFTIWLCTRLEIV